MEPVKDWPHYGRGDTFNRDYRWIINVKDHGVIAHRFKNQIVYENIDDEELVKDYINIHNKMLKPLNIPLVFVYQQRTFEDMTTSFKIRKRQTI
jgi:hypothetical protein